MNIVQVITELRPAGAEKIVTDLCIGLKKRNHDVTVVCLMPIRPPTDLVDVLRSEPINLICLNITKTNFIGIFKLRKILRKIKPDVVHSHLIHSNLLTRFTRLFSAGKNTYKLINTVHIAQRLEIRKWLYLLDKWTNSLCDKPTAVSKAARDFHCAEISIPQEDISVIYNGIQSPRILDNTEKAGLRAEWGMSHCAKIIGCVGRLAWQKGYDLLLEILPELSGSIPSGDIWGVVILGEGEDRDNLEELAKKLPYNIAISLPGFRIDAADCAGAFDLFVMPSRYEGFGLTLVEAMGHGIPIIANAVDSLPELMEHYSNGKVVNFSVNNSNIIIDSLHEFIKKGNIPPLNIFSVDRMVDEYLKLY